MNILVLGSGGREHAICHAISRSKQCDNLYAIPGNPGIEKIATCIDLDPLDNEKLLDFASKNHIDLVVPGSEVYLENGIADAFTGTNTLVFGPTKKAARIESSKEFAKQLMMKYHIPTADYAVFNDFQQAKSYIENNKIPTVIKYDGLAGGKGVVVAMTKEEAIDALDIMLNQKKYGNNQVIIEEYLEGPEFSLMCFVHGDKIIPMPIAQDHKRLLDKDQGPNTGGMGIYSPVPMIPVEIVENAIKDIMIPTVQALKKEDASFTGFLYGGLMLTKEGPKVIEFNARFGDPEAEVILPQLQTDFIAIIDQLLQDEIIDISWSNQYHVGVVMASKGYPESYQKGYIIDGLDRVEGMVYHMGTKKEKNQIITNGGRVLLVLGTAEDLPNAIKKAYQNVYQISCDNLIYRNDIGHKSLRGKTHG
jgi:phosphoribosylamine--glycine ligase